MSADAGDGCSCASSSHTFLFLMTRFFSQSHWRVDGLDAHGRNKP